MPKKVEWKGWLGGSEVWKNPSIRIKGTNYSLGGAIGNTIKAPFSWGGKAIKTGGIAALVVGAGVVGTALVSGMRSGRRYNGSSSGDDGLDALDKVNSPPVPMLNFAATPGADTLMGEEKVLNGKHGTMILNQRGGVPQFRDAMNPATPGVAEGAQDLQKAGETPMNMGA